MNLKIISIFEISSQAPTAQEQAEQIRRGAGFHYLVHRKRRKDRKGFCWFGFASCGTIFHKNHISTTMAALHTQQLNTTSPTHS
jgi:hypothetical protein